MPDALINTTFHRLSGLRTSATIHLFIHPSGWGALKTINPVSLVNLTVEGN